MRAGDPTPSVDRIDELTAAERWMADARPVVDVPGGIIQRVVDMTRAKASVRALRDRGVDASFVHLMVRATALALARNPQIYHLVCGYDRLQASSVDIGLSTGGLATDLPVVVPAADQKPLAALVAAVDDAVAVARAKQDLLQHAGWLASFGFVRRWLLRRGAKSLASRRRHAGTFEVSCDSNADVVVPLRFYTDAVLSAGRVTDVVVAIDGEPTIRPMACLSLCIDHVAMDGMRAAALINAVKEILESDELLAEAQGVAPGVAPEHGPAWAHA